MQIAQLSIAKMPNLITDARKLESVVKKLLLIAEETGEKKRRRAMKKCVWIRGEVENKV